MKGRRKGKGKEEGKGEGKEEGKGERKEEGKGEGKGEGKEGTAPLSLSLSHWGPVLTIHGSNN